MSMYDAQHNLMICFHGCDKITRDQLVNDPQKIKISEKEHEWLGHGFYLWQNNYTRAVQWAQDKVKRGLIKEAAVVGAVIDLGHCCDFLDAKHTDSLQLYYSSMKEAYEGLGYSLPRNRNLPDDLNQDFLLRELDCAAIEYMHSEILARHLDDLQNKGYTNARIFDTVRGLFEEGRPVFDGSRICEKSHIQICIRNPNSIKGFFIPREETYFYNGNMQQPAPFSTNTDTVALA